MLFRERDRAWPALMIRRGVARALRVNAGARWSFYFGWAIRIRAAARILAESAARDVTD